MFYPESAEAAPTPSRVPPDFFSPKAEESGFLFQAWAAHLEPSTLLPLSSLVPVGTGSGNWVWVWGKVGMQLQGSRTNAPA